MAYRNGVYAAFDGQGKTNPTESDLRYFALLKAWAEEKGEDFKYIDSHQKTNAVRDTSKAETLKRTLRERLSNSKVMIIILSNDTNFDRGFLNYEIEKALDTYKLPLILTYPGIEGNIDDQWLNLEKRWPRALRERLNDKSRWSDLSCMHITFKKDQITKALGYMTVHDIKYKGPKWFLKPKG